MCMCSFVTSGRVMIGLRRNYLHGKLMLSDSIIDMDADSVLVCTSVSVVIGLGGNRLHGKLMLPDYIIDMDADFSD